VFPSIGLEKEIALPLKRLLAAKGDFGKLGDGLSVLVTKIRDLESVEVPLFATESDWKKGPFKIGGSAGIKALARKAKEIDPPIAFGLSPAPSEADVEFVLQGTAGFKADTKTPAWGASLNASTSVSAALSSLHFLDRDKTLGECVIEIAQVNDAWGTLAFLKNAPPSLKRIRLDIDGKLSVQAKIGVEVGEAYEWSRDEVKLKAVTKASASAGVGVTIRGTYRLCADRGTDGSLAISLKRGYSSDRSLTLQAGAEIKLAGLDTIGGKVAKSLAVPATEKRVATEVTSVLESVVGEGISVEITAGVTSGRAEDLLFDCVIAANATEKQMSAFLTALWQGELKLDQVFDDSRELKPGFVSAGGKLVDTFTRKTSWSLSLNLFGWSLSEGATKSSTVKVERGLFDRLLVVRSTSELDAFTKTFDYVKKSRIDFGFGVGSIDAPIALNMIYTLKDEEVKSASLMGFVDSLQKMNLISVTGRTQVKQDLGLDRADTDHRLRDLELSLKFALKPYELESWTIRSSEEIANILGDAFLPVLAFADSTERPVSYVLRLLSESAGSDDELEILRFAISQGASRIENLLETKGGLRLTGTSKQVAGARALIHCLRTIQALQDSTRDLREFIKVRREASAVIGTDGTFDAGRLRDLTAKLSSRLAIGNRSSNSLMGNEDFIPLTTGGLARALLLLCGRSQTLATLKLSYSAGAERIEKTVA
jgi:hypothetical protein